jgi:hypothetical protein
MPSFEMINEVQIFDFSIVQPVLSTGGYDQDSFSSYF